jgi:hypothetical protein
MKTIIAILILWIGTGAIYFSMVLNETKSEARLNHELYKACSAELDRVSQ